jgi:carbamoyl-phosphate synthase large subunit
LLLKVKPIRVLIPSAGAGPAVAAIKLLRDQKSLPVRVLAADMDPAAPGLFLAHESAISPAVHSPKHLSWLVTLVRARKIDFVIPILDLDVAFFGKNREKIERRTKARVLGASFGVFELCNDKRRSVEHCRRLGFNVPRVWSPAQVGSRSFRSFPVIAKPNRGIGSKGVRIARSRREWDAIGRLPPDALIQSYVEGPEYTIDTLSDGLGRCLVAIPRERIRVRDGQIVKGRTRRNTRIIRFGKRIAEAFGICGPACIQCKISRAKICFIEINPRYGTGVSLSGAAGVNIPLLHLKLALGRTTGRRELDFADGVLMNRYWEEVYLPGKRRRGKS